MPTSRSLADGDSDKWVAAKVELSSRKDNLFEQKRFFVETARSFREIHEPNR